MKDTPGRDDELMEGLMQLFDRKYQEYQDYLDEKSWADAALAQSYLLPGVLYCMWAHKIGECKAVP